jgi:hypothetical protein
MDYQRRRGGLNNEDISGATQRQKHGMGGMGGSMTGMAGMQSRSKNSLEAQLDKYNISNLP